MLSKLMKEDHRILCPSLLSMVEAGTMESSTLPAGSG